jgi:hypothetical protein
MVVKRPMAELRRRAILQHTKNFSGQISPPWRILIFGFYIILIFTKKATASKADPTVSQLQCRSVNFLRIVPQA